ncbi:hypothetical protein D3C75_610060 [compost metagenome]
MLLDNMHPFLLAFLLTSDAIEAKLNVCPQHTPIGILIRRCGLVPKVAKAQCQPIATAKLSFFDTVMDFFVHSIKELVIVQNRPDSLTLVREASEDQAPFRGVEREYIAEFAYRSTALFLRWRQGLFSALESLVKINSRSTQTGESCQRFWRRPRSMRGKTQVNSSGKPRDWAGHRFIAN